MKKTYVTKNKLSVLGWLAQFGVCYRSDFVRCIELALDVTVQYAGRLLGNMENDGLVARYKTKRDNRDGKNETYEIIKIASAGWKLLADSDSYYKEYKDSYEKAAHKSDASEVRKMCTDARVKMMFFLAGAPVFPSMKPSLYHLYSSFAVPASDYNEEYDHKPLYRDSTSPAECKATLKTGIYYTIAEVREFLNEDSPGQSDTTYVSRARGIFISQTNLFIVYTCRRGNNKMLYLRTSEKNIIDAIRQLIRITDVRRTVLELSTFGMSSQGERIVRSPYSNDVDALVISDSDALVYAMAMGYPHGTVKPSSTDEPKTKPKWKKNFLDAENEDYARIFVTPYTPSGVDMLSYVCHTSAEQYHKDSVLLMQQINGFTPNGYNQLYPFDENGDRKIPAIFFPAYEVKELGRIAKSKGPVAIVTYHNMIDTIAHSVRKEIHYYDADTHEPVTSGITLYDGDGHPKGYNMICDVMTEHGFSPNRAQIVGIAKSYGLDPSEFFNRVAAGQIPADEALWKIGAGKLKPANVVDVEKPEMVQVSFFIPAELANDVKRAARYSNTSVSGYLKNLTVENTDRIHEDSEKYKEYLRSLRKSWKK